MVKIGPQEFDGRAGLGGKEIAKFGAGLVEEKRLGNCRGIIYCITQMRKGRGRRVFCFMRMMFMGCGRIALPPLTCP